MKRTEVILRLLLKRCLPCGGWQRLIVSVVQVNCIAYGWIKPAWGEKTSDYWQELAIRESALTRWGKPEGVAKRYR